MAKVDRLTRVNELLKREIAGLVERFAFCPPNMLLSVTEVSCSVDLRNATVKVSIFGGDAKAKREAMEELESRRAEFQRQLASTLGFKHTPVLAFRQDFRLERGDQVFRILNKAESEGDGKLS